MGRTWKIFFLGAKKTVKPVSEVDEENVDRSGRLLHSGDNGSINFSISAIAGPFARKDLKEVDTWRVRVAIYRIIRLIILINYRNYWISIT